MDSRICQKVEEKSAEFKRWQAEQLLMEPFHRDERNRNQFRESSVDVGIESGIESDDKPPGLCEESGTDDEMPKLWKVTPSNSDTETDSEEEEYRREKIERFRKATRERLARDTMEKDWLDELRVTKD